MELLAPAGNLEKLRMAYLYGADAAYIGLPGYSLRAQADNFRLEDAPAIAGIKGDRKLYGAFNLHCKDDDISRLEADRELIQSFPFDAFIISDLGLLPFFRKHFPAVELHLSTQANCLNTEAARIYRDLGFRRIIPGREMSLAEIARLKQALPELEIETFVHGAMCLAYSGRCFLSAWMSGRSANQGDCAHSCRWKYRLETEPPEPGEAACGCTDRARSGRLALREAERPDELFPVYEGEGFTSILSSKDLCLVDHLAAFRDAGVDSLKIEGRMKSSYYVAMVTRAYRCELDRVLAGERPRSAQDEAFIAELYDASHRRYSTGFFFSDKDIEEPTDRSYEASHLFLGLVGRELTPDPAWLSLHDAPAEGRWRRYELEVRNKFGPDDAVEVVSPNQVAHPLGACQLVDGLGRDTQRVVAGRYQEIYRLGPFEPGSLLRKSLGADGPTA